MNFLLSLLMFICIVPVTIILFFNMYPRNWKNKNRILGVNNRKEFKEEKAAEFIEVLYNTHRKQALFITIGIVVVSVMLMFVPVFFVQMIAWSVFIYAALILIAIPYMLGNSEMKRYKNSLGIINENVIYADLKNAGNVHALNKPVLIILNIIGFIILAAAFLLDMGVLPFEFEIFQGMFAVTMIVFSFEITNLIFLPIAFMVDNSRNEVISEDSNINANYNRARKKIFSDMVISVTLVNIVFSIIAVITFMLFNYEIATLVLVGLYMAALMLAVMLYAAKKMKLEEKYEETSGKLTEDDDDNWILGMFYYNPKDRKLNVEKRVGIGWTINIAHPVGKIFTGFGVLTIIASFLCLIWVAMMGSTPIRIIETNDYVICHHLWDEYKIAKEDIVSAELEDFNTFNAVKVAGTGMDNVAKGKFNVNGEKGCTLFLNPEAGNCIKIVTSDKTYYISDNTKEETLYLFDSLSK